MDSITTADISITNGVGDDATRNFGRSFPPAKRPPFEAAPRKAIDATEDISDQERPPEELDGRSLAPKRSTLRRKILIGAAVAAVGLAADFYYRTYVAPYESTDDAYIEANVTPIAPQVAGRVARLLVADNQAVEKGQVLLQIDPRDFRARLDQARATFSGARGRLEQARARLTVDRAKLGEAQANVTAATARAAQAAADAKRFQAVGDLGVSASQLDLAATQARSSAADVMGARSQVLAAKAQEKLDQANIASAQAEVEADAAAVRQAELDWSHTRVTAPVAGIVTHRTVASGAYVQAGQALLAIVPRRVWVVANFKETQLANIRRGQPVAVTVDAYPQLKLRGHVDSIQAGSGARFSLLPPENASGNFVKVVQRVPVKIVLDHTPGAPFVLGPGMSVVPKVRVQ